MSTGTLPSVPQVRGEVYLTCDACRRSAPSRDLERRSVELGRARGDGVEMAMIYIHKITCLVTARRNKVGIYA